MGLKRLDMVMIAGLFGLAIGCAKQESKKLTETNDLARAARCANLDERRCETDADCRPDYESRPNQADAYAGCVPADECPLDFVCPNGQNPQGANCECALGCETVLCAPGHQCIEGIAGPVCVPVCDDPNGCPCVTPQGDAAAPGTAFPSPDGCNSCVCDANGQVICTEIACPECPLDFVCPDGSNPVGPNCLCPDVCNPGMTHPGDPNDPNDPNRPTDPVPPPSDGCTCVTPDGQAYPAGASFPAPDGCNTCYCDANGQISCTEIACPECPLDVLCPDGSQPIGPECICEPTLSCANVLCAEGYVCIETDAGPECVPGCTGGDPNCVCPDVLCEDGTTPTGPNCQCEPTLSCATVLCAQGYVCVETTTGPECVPDCQAGDPNCVCPGIVCNDGSTPTGPNCECPPPTLTCANVLCAQGYTCVETATGPQCIPLCDAAGQNCSCVLADGTTVAPGTQFPAGDGCNVCVCGPNGQPSCTEIACGP